MTTETENKITWTTIVIGVIAAIVMLCFHQPRSPIGDCGTDVILNKGIGIFFTLRLGGTLVGGPFTSMRTGYGRETEIIFHQAVMEPEEVE